MNKPDDGGHAFPTLFIEPDYGSGYGGMSLRDYIATSALQGILAADRGHQMTAVVRDVRIITDIAYKFADSMLASRVNQSCL